MAPHADAEPEVVGDHRGPTYNLGSTDTAVRDGGLGIVVDPGVIQLGRQGAFVEGLRKV